MWSGRHGSRAQSAVLPAMRVAGLHPAQCRAELIPSNGGRSLPACCGARLDQARHGRRASTTLIALQAKILDLLAPGRSRQHAQRRTAGTAGPLLRRPPRTRAAGLLNLAGGPAPEPFGGNSVRRRRARHRAQAGSRQTGPRQARHPSHGRRSQRVPRTHRGPDPRRKPRRGPRAAQASPPAGSWKEGPAYWGLRAVRSATPVLRRPLHRLRSASVGIQQGRRGRQAAQRRHPSPALGT